MQQPIQDHRFLVLETVGRGGMGAVYRAFDRLEQRLVALKVVESKQRAGPAHPLSAEFDLWSRLRHPAVVRPYELRRASHGPLPPGAPYLVMEYFGGRPAHEALAPGRAPEPLLEELARHVLAGLVHVHDAGLIHRDLKPGNVLVRRHRDGSLQVKLTDFGLAARSGLTEPAGCLSGSLSYLAPESVIGKPLDGRVDLYALGILLYFLATGTMPVSSTDPERIVRWHLAGETLDPGRARPELSKNLTGFIRRLASRRRADRFADARSAARALGLTPAAPERRPPRVNAARRRRLRLAIDAARLGARRRLLLRGAPDEIDVLGGEARVTAQVHGLSYLTILPAGSNGSILPGLVLRLLVDGGIRLDRVMQRQRMAELLPLDRLGGVPIRDRRRGDALRDRCGEPAFRRAAARAMARLVLESANRRTLVLHVRHRLRLDPLTAEVLHMLEADLARRDAPDRNRGGLLLLIDAPGSGSADQRAEDLESAQVRAENAPQAR